jgi:anti-sigma regulatory factor (Ser/Thr protein kinase)
VASRDGPDTSRREGAGRNVIGEPSRRPGFLPWTRIRFLIEGGSTVVSHTHWHHHKEWPGEARHVREVRQFVARSLVHHGLEAVMEDAVLVVSELATNAVVHARTPFRVSLSRADEELLLEVADASTTQPRTVGSEPLALSGRGLSIVGTVSQAWGVQNTANGVKKVWASLPTPRVDDPARTVQA